MKRFIPLLIAILTAAMYMVIPVSAHANLVSSVPKAGEVLLQSPPEIVLEFTESLDPEVTKIELLDARGQVVTPGPGRIESDTPHVLRLRVDPLPDGVYSAVWRVRSAVDGHTTNGSVGFSIGEASPLASLLPPPGTPDPATRLPSTAESFARWLGYLSATIAAGSLSFGFLIWRPAYRGETNKSQAAEEEIRNLVRRLALTGLAALAIATVWFAIVQAAQALEISPWRMFDIPFSQLFAGRIGLWLGARLILIVILGSFVLRLPSPGIGSSRAWWLILVLAGSLLLTFSLQGHGAARGSIVGIVMIWLHFAAMTVWLGGLPLLFLALRQADVPASALVPRFSTAALISVGLIIATGIYNAFSYVGSVEALTATTYGRALILKTVLFAFLYILGTVNLFYVSPRLREEGNRARKTLGRTISIEMIVGLVLMLAIGVLSGVAPAFEALQVRREQGIIETARVEGVNMLLRVMPGESGENEIGVEFTDSRPGAEEVPPQVLLRTTSTHMDMGTQQIETTSVDGLRYTARGSFFPMIGPWELEIIIRRAGFNDVRKTFELDIQDPSVP